MDVADRPLAKRLWNDAMGERFPLRPALLDLALDDRRRWVGAVTAWHEGRLVGWAYATQASGDAPRIQAVVVEAGLRRRGIGSRLVNGLAEAAPRATSGIVEVGGGTGYLWPAIPEDLRGATAFCEAIGFELGDASHDLRGDIRDLSPPDASVGVDRDVSFGPATPEEMPAVLAFVAQAFDPDWSTDLAAFLDDAGRPGDVFLARRDGRPVGFARLHFEDSHPLGPPMFWPRSGRGVPGGLGPIGVATTDRGRGAGSRLLHAALWHLRTSGATDIVIDFTHLLSFYGRFGFGPWMAFRHARRPQPQGPR